MSPLLSLTHQSSLYLSLFIHLLSDTGSILRIWLQLIYCVEVREWRNALNSPWLQFHSCIMGSYWVILTQWALFSVLLVSRLRMPDVWITWEGSGSLEPRSPSVPDEPDSCIIHSGPDPFHYWDEPRCEGYTVIEFDQLGPTLLYSTDQIQATCFISPYEFF